MALTKINTRSLSGTLTASQYPIASSDLPAGSVLQTTKQLATTATQYSSGIHKVLFVDLTTKKANSHFRVDLVFTVCAPNVDNRDPHNRTYQFGYRTPTTSGSASNVTDWITPAQAGRSGASNVNSYNMGMGGVNIPLENSDVIYGQGAGAQGGTWGSDYESVHKSFSFIIDSLTEASGTTINFAMWMRNTSSMVFSGVHYQLNASDQYNGSTSSILVTEIAA